MNKNSSTVNCQNSIIEYSINLYISIVNHCSAKSKIKSTLICVGLRTISNREKLQKEKKNHSIPQAES